MVSPLPAQQADAEKREIRIARGTSLRDFLAEVAREEHAVILCTEAQNVRLAKAVFEVDVNHTVAKERYVDACRSILAFYGLSLIPFERGVWYIRDQTPRGIGPPPDETATERVVLIGAGGKTTLVTKAGDLSHSLTPALRERLLCSLRGIHAGGRVLAARLLGCLGPADKATLAALRKATKDEDPHVRLAAAHAITTSAR